MSGDDLKDRIDTIEEGYEFFLAYAAQGLTDDAASKAGTQVRDYLSRYEEVLDGLDTAFRARLPAGEATESALAVLRRDAEASRAFVRLVAAQPAVSSQLIDNLNASIHIRALLTDVFVLGELVGV
ncbi:MAG: hypothetical protein OXE96_03270 [Gemmatimonadetes bacterium]|nr:hypothetical protein [Gemmatimonadota bacterium]